MPSGAASAGWWVASAMRADSALRTCALRTCSGRVAPVPLTRANPRVRPPPGCRARECRAVDISRVIVESTLRSPQEHTGAPAAKSARSGRGQWDTGARLAEARPPERRLDRQTGMSSRLGPRSHVRSSGRGHLGPVGPARPRRWSRAGDAGAARRARRGPGAGPEPEVPARPVAPGAAPALVPSLRCRRGARSTDVAQRERSSATEVQADRQSSGRG